MEQKRCLGEWNGKKTYTPVSKLVLWGGFPLEDDLNEERERLLDVFDVSTFPFSSECSDVVSH